MYGATAGKVGWLGIKAVTNQAVLAITPKDENKYNSRWLYWALLHSADKLTGQVQGSGQPNLSKSLVDSHQILFPTKCEQTKIAAILDTLDTALQRTEAIIEKLKQVKQGLLHDLLTRGIDANGELRPTPTEAPDRYKNSPVGLIPKAWECKILDDLAEFENGNTFDARAWSGDGLPIIRIQNLNGSREFNYYTGKSCPRWHVYPGDLLFAWAGQRGISFGARIWSGPEGVLNQHIFKVSPFQRVVSKIFLYRLLRFYQNRIEDTAHGFKDSFLHVSRKELGGINIGVPNADEQSCLEMRISEFEGKESEEEESLLKLINMKFGLMDDLLTGRVRVTDLLAAAPG